MVQQGGFKVELVQADSKQPFKEHTSKDGKVYVEMEPDAEYFIAIQNLGNATHRGKSIEAHYVSFVVDGVPLSYYQSFCKNMTDKLYRGIWSVKGGTQKTQALRSIKMSSRLGNLNDDNLVDKIGKIEVWIYEGIQGDKYIQGDHEADSLGTATQAGSVLLQDKLIRSTVGSSAIVTAQQGMTMRFSKGQFLQKITLNYCTVPGLIAVGILPRYFRHQEKYKKRCLKDSEYSTLQSQIKRIKSTKVSKTVVENGQKLTRQYTMIDLSRSEKEDSDEGSDEDSDDDEDSDEEGGKQEKDDDSSTSSSSSSETDEKRPARKLSHLRRSSSSSSKRDKKRPARKLSHLGWSSSSLSDSDTKPLARKLSPPKVVQVTQTQKSDNNSNVSLSSQDSRISQRKSRSKRDNARGKKESSPKNYRVFSGEKPKWTPMGNEGCWDWFPTSQTNKRGFHLWMYEETTEE